MKYLQKTLMIVLVSILGILFSVSNSWAPIIIGAKSDKVANKSLASITNLTICYNATKTSGNIKYGIQRMIIF